MRVTPDSPVQDRQSYLFQWDTAARKYFNHYEVHKNAARENLRRLFQNFLTRNRDPIQFEHRFREVDQVVARQLLGEISQDEIRELNSALGSKNGSYYTLGMKEPATIHAWKIWPSLIFGGASGAIALYARFIKGYNNLWLAGGFFPLLGYVIYNYARQPSQEILNCYNYLLAKRAATCELQSNAKRFNQNAFTQTEQFRALRQALEARNITIYQLEAELVDKINAG